MRCEPPSTLFLVLVVAVILVELSSRRVEPATTTPPNSSVALLASKTGDLEVVPYGDLHAALVTKPGVDLEAEIVRLGQLEADAQLGVYTNMIFPTKAQADAAYVSHDEDVHIRTLPAAQMQNSLGDNTLKVDKNGIHNKGPSGRCILLYTTSNAKDPDLCSNQPTARCCPAWKAAWKPRLDKRATVVGESACRIVRPGGSFRLQGNVKRDVEYGKWNRACATQTFLELDRLKSNVTILAKGKLAKEKCREECDKTVMCDGYALHNDGTCVNLTVHTANAYTPYATRISTKCTKDTQHAYVGEMKLGAAFTEV